MIRLKPHKESSQLGVEAAQAAGGADDDLGVGVYGLDLGDQLAYGLLGEAMVDVDLTALTAQLLEVSHDAVQGLGLPSGLGEQLQGAHVGGAADGADAQKTCGGGGGLTDAAVVGEVAEGLQGEEQLGLVALEVGLEPTYLLRSLRKIHLQEYLSLQYISLLHPDQPF